MKLSHLAHAGLATLALLWTSGCIVAVESKGANVPGEVQYDEDGEYDDAADADDDGLEAEKLERELQRAQMKMQVAALGAGTDRLKAQRKVDDAGRELEQARRALDLFLSYEQPHELAESQLSLDRAHHRRELQVDELKELEAMYAEEDFAEMTKELVLKRGRKNVEFAERSLELAMRKFEVKRTEELPKRQRELEQKVVAAEGELRDAEVGREKNEIQVELDLMEARTKLEEAEREMRKAEEARAAELEEIEEFEGDEEPEEIEEVESGA